MRNGKRWQRCLTYNGDEYPAGASVRKAIEQPVRMQNIESERAKVDASSRAIIDLDKSKHLTGLEASTQQTNRYLLDRYIEPRFPVIRSQGNFPSPNPVPGAFDDSFSRLVSLRPCVRVFAKFLHGGGPDSLRPPRPNPSYTLHLERRWPRRAPLTQPGSLDYTPSWSPKGDWIVLMSERSGSADLFRIHLDGTGIERLTDDPAYDDQAAFSPDGARIAFVSTRAGGRAIRCRWPHSGWSVVWPVGNC
jgi:hypothetical protein